MNECAAQMDAQPWEKDFHVLKLQIIREDEAEGSRRAGATSECVLSQDANFATRIFATQRFCDAVEEFYAVMQTISARLSGIFSGKCASANGSASRRQTSASE